MDIRPARWPLLAAAATAMVFTAPASAERRPGMREARAAARAVVVEHPTYRSIRSNEPLVTRSCWRSRRAVRCSLYRWAPTPCALDGMDGICIQVMTRRIWLVEVRRRRGRAVARIKRVEDTSALPVQRAIRRNSS
jgi:hypothetical protein